MKDEGKTENQETIIAANHAADVETGLTEAEASESDAFERRILGMVGVHRFPDSARSGGISITTLTKPTSRLVRGFKSNLVRCKCGLLPVEVTFTSPLGVTHHRFECPECDNPAVRWEWSHAKAAAEWLRANCV